jgi:Ca2+:H+ antiporter
VDTPEFTDDLAQRVLHISRITAILLIVAYTVYVWFQMRTHESIYDAIFEADEAKDRDRHRDLTKAKLTFTECVGALAVAITLVTIIAISLVNEIEFIISDHGVSESFVGLILVPLVEKFAEHLTAIDEAYDNQMNMALAHVLGATIQTSLFNAPLVVLVGWGLNKSMDFNFSLFNVVVLILAILVVGNFLRDQKSNYLEGTLCVIVYINIAVAAFYYPNVSEGVDSPALGNSTIETTSLDKRLLIGVLGGV